MLPRAVSLGNVADLEALCRAVLDRFLRKYGLAWTESQYEEGLVLCELPNSEASPSTGSSAARSGETGFAPAEHPSTSSGPSDWTRVCGIEGDFGALGSGGEFTTRAKADWIPAPRTALLPLPARSAVGRRCQPDCAPRSSLQRSMAPGGVEPPHADSKSAALSAELRGRQASVVSPLCCSFAPAPAHPCGPRPS